MTVLNPPGKSAISPLFFGFPAEAGQARRFVAAHLDEIHREAALLPGECHPCRDDAVQLIGELIAESLRHASACGTHAGYTVTVRATPVWTRVTMATRGCGCWTSPARTPGRGVHVVDLFTTRWGVTANQLGTSVWFELGHAALTARGNGPDAFRGRADRVGDVVDTHAER